MARSAKPCNAYELLGLNDPNAQGDPPATNTKKPILTPALLRRFIHLPHVENFMFLFVLSLNPENSYGLPKDKDHMADQVIELRNRFKELAAVCNKTPGFKQARFSYHILSDAGFFSYRIIISIDRSTFKGLPP
ncbi:uncharacterized protein LOC118433076 [Folsomia candida]|nr:uncharacterized protein LOC118433076 [Folsomia candida]